MGCSSTSRSYFSLSTARIARQAAFAVPEHVESLKNLDFQADFSTCGAAARFAQTAMVSKQLRH
jgi:hypothetical protein